MPTKGRSSVAPVGLPSASTTGRTTTATSTTTSRVSPSRVTVKLAGPAPAARIAAVSCSQVSTPPPSTAVTTSPAASPATAAGDAGEPAQRPWASAAPVRLAAVGVQGTTWSTVVVGFGVPIATRTTVKSTNARIRFIVGPPSMTTIFLGVLSL